ncbi:MAG TPA: VOC family protein [Lacipirellulaceae bacterium]|nr:VOC family protein [Verrucomicrobiota bacterium]HMO83739.1 VOC family protein [Lacipirellulaceae bacterium]
MAENTSRLTGSAPVLLVADVVKSANYFRDQLGFTYERFWGEPPDFCMVQRDGLVVMLALAPPGASLIPHWKVVDRMWNAYFWCDDAEGLYAEFVRRGARIDYGLGVKHYGIKEFGIQDLDGNDIAFGQRI